MGGVNVKNTMIERVLGIIAPHPCLNCGKIGSILCPHCKYDIIDQPFVGCFVCATPHLDGICQRHHIPIKKSYIVGLRTGALRDLLDLLKFQRGKAAARAAAELLHARLPLLPPDTILVPIPTLRKHVRQRGYDQVALITQHLAQLRSLEVTSLLKRIDKGVQHERDRAGRLAVRHSMVTLTDANTIDLSRPILIIDDIITTGATMMAAAKQFSNAGATVMVAAIAYQPLD